MTLLAAAGAALWTAVVLAASTALWQRTYPVQPGQITPTQRLAVGAAVALDCLRTYLRRDWSVR